MVFEDDLIKFARAGDTKNVKRLLSSGGRVDSASAGDGTTALHAAAEHGHAGLVRLLIVEYKAGIDGRDSDGYTALNRAAAKGADNVVSCLLELKAALDLPNERKDTPLISAVKEGYYDTVRILVSAGARLDLRGDERKTAREWARERKFEDIATFFAQREQSAGASGAAALALPEKSTPASMRPTERKASPASLPFGGLVAGVQQAVVSKEEICGQFDTIEPGVKVQIEWGPAVLISSSSVRRGEAKAIAWQFIVSRSPNFSFGALLREERYQGEDILASQSSYPLVMHSSGCKELGRSIDCFEKVVTVTLSGIEAALIIECEAKEVARLRIPDTSRFRNKKICLAINGFSGANFQFLPIFGAPPAAPDAREHKFENLGVESDTVVQAVLSERRYCGMVDSLLPGKSVKFGIGPAVLASTQAVTAGENRAIAWQFRVTGNNSFSFGAATAAGLAKHGGHDLFFDDESYQLCINSRDTHGGNQRQMDCFNKLMTVVLDGKSRRLFVLVDGNRKMTLPIPATRQFSAPVQLAIMGFQGTQYAFTELDNPSLAALAGPSARVASLALQSDVLSSVAIASPAVSAKPPAEAKISGPVLVGSPTRASPGSPNNALASSPAGRKADVPAPPSRSTPMLMGSPPGGPIPHSQDDVSAASVKRTPVPSPPAPACAPEPSLSATRATLRDKPHCGVVDVNPSVSATVVKGPAVLSSKESVTIGEARALAWCFRVEGNDKFSIGAARLTDLKDGGKATQIMEADQMYPLCLNSKEASGGNTRRFDGFEKRVTVFLNAKTAQLVVMVEGKEEYHLHVPNQKEFRDEPICLALHGSKGTLFRFAAISEAELLTMSASRPAPAPAASEPAAVNAPAPSPLPALAPVGAKSASLPSARTGSLQQIEALKGEIKALKGVVADREAETKQLRFSEAEQRKRLFLAAARQGVAAEDVAAALAWQNAINDKFASEAKWAADQEARVGKLATSIQAGLAESVGSRTGQKISQVRREVTLAIREYKAAIKESKRTDTAVQRLKKAVRCRDKTYKEQLKILERLTGRKASDGKAESLRISKLRVDTQEAADAISGYIARFEAQIKVFDNLARQVPGKARVAEAAGPLEGQMAGKAGGAHESDERNATVTDEEWARVQAAWKEMQIAVTNKFNALARPITSPCSQDSRAIFNELKEAAAAQQRARRKATAALNAVAARLAQQIRAGMDCIIKSLRAALAQATKAAALASNWVETGHSDIDQNLLTTLKDVREFLRQKDLKVKLGRECKMWQSKISEAKNVLGRAKTAHNLAKDKLNSKKSNSFAFSLEEAADEDEGGVAETPTASHRAGMEQARQEAHECEEAEKKARDSLNMLEHDAKYQLVLEQLASLTNNLPEIQIQYDYLDLIVKGSAAARK